MTVDGFTPPARLFRAKALYGYYVDVRKPLDGQCAIAIVGRRSATAAWAVLRDPEEIRQLAGCLLLAADDIEAGG